MGRKTILLVDDSETALVMHRMILCNNTPYQVITAKDGAEAVEAATRLQPDLIVMDVVMPRMSGLEACSAMRARSETKKIPIILVTTRGEEGAVEGGYEAGCNDYLTKPVDPAELVTLVTSYLGTRDRAHEKTESQGKR